MCVCVRFRNTAHACVSTGKEGPNLRQMVPRHLISSRVPEMTSVVRGLTEDRIDGELCLHTTGALHGAGRRRLDPRDPHA